MWIKEGLEKGQRKGNKKERMDDARKIIKLNVSPDVIHEITGLSKKKIEELRNK
ncbi:MAG TPA: hypothetical protein VFD91_12675 [Mariniphaga sp.]|nr:hypothetical protein [Mariniphaga sp.]